MSQTSALKPQRDAQEAQMYNKSTRAPCTFAARSHCPRARVRRLRGLCDLSVWPTADGACRVDRILALYLPRLCSDVQIRIDLGRLSVLISFETRNTSTWGLVLGFSGPLGISSLVSRHPAYFGL